MGREVVDVKTIITCLHGLFSCMSSKGVQTTYKFVCVCLQVYLRMNL